MQRCTTMAGSIPHISIKYEDLKTLVEENILQSLLLLKGLTFEIQSLQELKRITLEKKKTLISLFCGYNDAHFILIQPQATETVTSFNFCNGQMNGKNVENQWTSSMRI